MIIGAEVAMLVLGLYALFAGQLLTGKKAKYVVRGWPARLISVIYLLPIPLAVLVNATVVTVLVASGRPATRESFVWVGTAIEGLIVFTCDAVAVVLWRVYRTPVEAAPPEGAGSGASDGGGT
jgi:hypothetical protein